MKETILGISQELAVNTGLDIVDVMLLAVVKDKMENENTRKLKYKGRIFVWVSYQDVLDHLPILGIKKRRLAARFDAMCSKGLLDKYVDKEAGCYTFFRLSLNEQGVVTPQTGGCHSTDKGVVTPATYKELPENKLPESSKEKENNKLFSKKKVDDDNPITETNFRNKALQDEQLDYCLKPYHIKDKTALINEFLRHVKKNNKLNELKRNGYMRNTQWLLRSMPFLNLTEATGHKIGVGESLRDGKRYYLIHGEQREVPMDAPPRQLKDQVWYAREKRWGPDV